MRMLMCFRRLWVRNAGAAIDQPRIIPVATHASHAIAPANLHISIERAFWRQPVRWTCVDRLCVIIERRIECFTEDVIVAKTCINIVKLCLSALYLLYQSKQNAVTTMAQHTSRCSWSPAVGMGSGVGPQPLLTI